MGVPVDRVINTGGVPRRSGMINRVYANVLGNSDSAYKAILAIKA